MAIVSIVNELIQLVGSIQYFKMDKRHVKFLEKTRKQLDKLDVENPHLKYKLVSHYKISEDQLKNIPPFPLFDTVEVLFNSDNNNNIFSINLDILKNEMMDKLLNVMDIGALARILRKFGDNDTNTLKVAFLGDEHRKAWVKFFTHAGLINGKARELIAETNKCLEISKNKSLQRYLRNLI